MLFLANASSPRVRAAITTGSLGQIVTPAEGRAPLTGATWCADNSCFGSGYPGDAAWFAWLSGLAERHDLAHCLFATAPDVVGDAEATHVRSLPWLPKIRRLGYPAAFVAQDGLTVDDTPWPDFDVLFIGGSTEFKLGPVAAEITRAARARGHPVHMGRVNSYRRYRYAQWLGCSSVDGTTLAFGPDVNLPLVQSWTAQLAFDTE